MTDIVRRTEDIIKVSICFAIRHFDAIALSIRNDKGFICELCCCCRLVCLVHDVGAWLINLIIHLNRYTVDISVWHEVGTLCLTKLVPVPPSNDIVQLVSIVLVVNGHMINRLIISI